MNTVTREGWAKPLFSSTTSKSPDSQHSTFMAPSSVTVATSVPSNPVSLSLVKISYCTTPASHSNMLWNHLPFRDGMFAVFDTDRRRDNDGLVIEKRVLKLVCKSEQLERIDLDALKSQALLDEKLSESQHIPDQDLRILVIVKKPLLAIRYQLPDEQIRRVQLNFKPESGFDYAINTLRSVGLPIRIKTGTTTMPQTIRPQSAQAAFPGQSYLCSQDRYREVRQSQSYAPPSAQPALSPVHVSSQWPIYPQQSLTVSGIDQDELSRPLLSTTQFDTSSGNSRPEYRLLQAPPSSLPSLTQQHGVSTTFRHVSTHVGESKGFDSQTNAYGPNSTRPDIAPDAQPERFEPDTIPLSQVLPPDRVLPFPEEKEKSLINTSNPTQVSQKRARSSASASTKARPKPKTRRAKDVEDKVSIRTTDAPTAGSESFEAGRVKTSWSLKSGSSPSSRVATSKLTVVEEIPSKMTKSEKDKITKLGQLANGPWTLTKFKFLQHFNKEVYGGPAFIEELNKFSKIQSDFVIAYPLMLAAQQARRGCAMSGHRNQYTDREWLAIDVKNAMSAYQESLKQIQITSAPVKKANTPRKRVRTISPAPERHPDSVAAVTDQVALESLGPDLSTPSLSRVHPILTREQAAAALERSSRTPEIRIANNRAKSAPALTQHTSVAAAEPEKKLATAKETPANSQTNHVQVVEHQIPTPTLNLSQGPDNAQTDYVVVQGRQDMAAPTTNTILPLVQPAELVSSLDDWIRSYQRVPARSAAPQTAMEVLAEYAAQDDETRAAAIDDMICECLADENFEKLVEDVQGAWMRVGLGF